MSHAGSETWERVIYKGVELNYDVSTLGRVRNATTKRLRRVRLSNGKTTKYRAVSLYDRPGRERLPAAPASRRADRVFRPGLAQRPARQPADRDPERERLAEHDLGTRRLPSRMRYPTADEHARIRELWATSEYRQTRLAEMFETTNATVSRIVNGHRRPGCIRSTPDGKCTSCPMASDPEFRTCSRCRQRQAAKMEKHRRKQKSKRAALMRA